MPLPLKTSLPVQKPSGQNNVYRDTGKVRCIYSFHINLMLAVLGTLSALGVVGTLSASLVHHFPTSRLQSGVITNDLS